MIFSDFQICTLLVLSRSAAKLKIVFANAVAQATAVHVVRFLGFTTRIWLSLNKEPERAATDHPAVCIWKPTRTYSGAARRAGGRLTDAPMSDAQSSGGLYKLTNY